MNIKRIILVLVCIFTLILCSTVSAADTSNITANNTNSSFHSLQSSTSVKSTSSQIPDPIISGVVKDNSTNKGLGNVTIKVIQNNTQVAQTTTRNDGTYSLNFINSNTTYTIIASKLGYMPISKTMTVKRSSNLSDPNFYGIADFKLYKLLKYSGNASSYVLNIGALPQILLDIYAGKSSAGVNSSSTTYSTGGGSSLEIKLLTASLLSGLLDVYSTGNEGYKSGGLLPTTNSTLNKILNNLGLNIGLLSAESNSSANTPSASGTSTLASIDLDITLLKALHILSLNVGAVGSSSSVIPNFNTGVLVSTSKAGVANITVTLLGDKLLEIKALQTSATALVNGKPGGASATFNWQVASIKLLGATVTLDQLKAGIEIPGILTLSLGGQKTNTSADGTYAKVSGDALRLQVLDILGGGLVNLIIGHVEAEAQVPVGGLHVNTSDLEVTKTVNNTHPNYLQNITYTLKVHNNGPDAAAGVIVTDKLPSGLKFISANGNGTYNITTGIWTIGTLTNGAEATLNIIAQVIASNTKITNIADITGTNYDPDPNNDQSNSTITVGTASDLKITKTANNTNPKYLENVTFTLIVHNYGPDAATGVKVTDKLPAGLKFISSNGNYDSATGIWTIGTLTNGAEATLSIIAQVIVSNTKITNIAEVKGDNYDQNSTNNQSNTTITVGAASDLKIIKTVNNACPNYLQNVTYTLTAHNNGPNTATGVKVTDKLPAGLKFISASGNGTYNSTTGTWTIGNLANGKDAILKIIAQVITSNAKITNIASINGTNYDQNSTNNRNNSTITVNLASDLGITKTVNNANPKYLQKVTFTLTAHNYGPDNATGIKVTDKLPAGLKFISASGNGTYNSTTGTWTIGNLANGATAVLNIVAQATAPNTKVTNTATITGNNYDQKSSNNNAAAIVKIGPAADLAVKISVNNAHPKYKQKVTFTITAYNYGPMNAKNVTVTLKMPKGFKYISKDKNIQYNSKTGVWTIGNLKNGSKVVMHIVEQAMVSNVKLTTVASIKGNAIIT
ncbi:carboxypeptidase regulatory-like domain-containing protein [Methanobacterium veterum]|uniref:Carboxypeptidase regulatory-like domain-containing protein n=4 Tax=Methanobacterium TaxID=2160 RepID=A0A9E5A298_9EURY|nr:carboxypeptidase regulatory-like domain-containing protein [Methanobacterium veterum]MCZ3365826.1 carboxypeptidase regulatory-like domain-containing protein [Methanobacterium veterum]MCZ3371291.1 carboxypeptidase regulatory-like domain-containing protein [Methanobacterium veterum]